MNEYIVDFSMQLPYHIRVYQDDGAIKKKMRILCEHTLNKDLKKMNENVDDNCH